MTFEDVVVKFGSVLGAVREYGSIRAASRSLGIPRTTLRRFIEKESSPKRLLAEKQAKEVAEPAKSSDALTDVCESLNIKQSEVRGAWLKGPEASVWLRREPKSVEKELSADFVALLDSARRYVVRGPESPNADSMLVVCPVDAHFGKLAYHGETNEDYDPSIAATIYRQAVSDALTHFNPGRIKKIVLVIGSDQLNADSSKSMTTSGTVVQSVDTRYTRVFDIAVAATIAAIEDCVQIADVHVPVVPGNHDELSSCLLAKVVKQYFRHDPRVFVDDDEILRKYIHFGTNLIGLTHRFTKFDTAPVLMATEKPAEWGITTCREFLTGHLHTTRAKAWTPYYEVSGVVVRITSSLSSTDLWHFANGYCGNIRACESWIYSETDGMYGMHVAKVRL